MFTAIFSIVFIYLLSYLIFNVTLTHTFSVWNTQTLLAYKLVNLSSVCFTPVHNKGSLQLHSLTEQKPWKGPGPTPQTIDLVMGTPRHLLRQSRCGRVVALTSWSRTGKVLLSPTSPQPAVTHLLNVFSLVLFSEISLTASVSCALLLSWDKDSFIKML